MNILSCHKHFAPCLARWLITPIPCIPKPLAWSVKGHGLPQLALQPHLPTAMDILTDSNYLHILKWASSLTSGPWRVLLPACNVLPILSLVCLANSFPLFRTHFRYIFPRDAILTPRGRGKPHNILFWAPQPITQKHRPFFSFLFPLFPVPLFFGALPFLTQIPSHTKFLIMSAMKTTYQKMN